MFRRLGKTLSKSGRDDFEVKANMVVQETRIHHYPSRLLKEEHHEFRLLTIYPASHDAPIVCTLTPVSLNGQVTAYEALSSTPGSGLRDYSIIVDSHEFHVTEHVSDALRILRYEAHVRLLWVEWICVNDIDNGEKLSQLHLKTHIFARAERVIAWLGTGTINTHETFRIVNKHIEATKASLSSGIDWNDPYGYAIITNIAQDILSRKWWSWAANVSDIVDTWSILIQCGSSYVSWMDFMQFWKWLKGQSFESDKLLSNAHLDTINNIKTAYSSGNRQDLTQLCLHLFEFEATDPRDKIAAALSVRERNTNQLQPRQLYARPLAEVQANLTNTCIHVDLSLDFLSLAGLSEVSLRSSSWLPELLQPQPAWKPLEILSQSCYSNLIGPSPNTAGSPSHSPFAATRETSPNASITTSPTGKTVLSTSGLPIDVVELVPTSALGRSTPSLLKTWEIVLSYAFGTLEPFQSLTDRWATRMSPRILNPESKKAKFVECLVDGNPEHCELRQELFRKARDKLLDSIPQYSHRKGRLRYAGQMEFQEAYYRTILTDRSGKRRERVSDSYLRAAMSAELDDTENEEAHLNTVTHLLEDVLPDVPTQSRYSVFRDDFLSAVERSLQFRTLFTTRSGYIGLGPSTIKKADVVVLLLGCSVPVALRSTGKDGFAVVGECFVHGIMDGEVMQEGWEKEVQSFNIV